MIFNPVDYCLFPVALSYEWGIGMEAKVDQDLCISCGLCVSSCPDVFSWGDDEKAEAHNAGITNDNESCVQDAAESCPTDAIKVH
ncbi:MAG TPA: ferredoxin [Bacillota bacterium]